MRSVRSSKLSIFVRALVCACALSLVATGGPAEAAKKAPRKEASQKRVKKKGGGGGSYAPPYAELVVDAKTGKVLAAENPDAQRHPASLTKVMTLYLLFDELDRGNLNLKTPLVISAEAARQPPSKIGLLPNQTIEVEDAIKALITKSANDVAVAVAENIAGSEAAFAERMTQKARSLGMRSTVYLNASGLPNPGQVTTARDLVLLGRAIQDNHANYYRYFSTRSFAFSGQSYANHNKLLGNVKGVDGIKTGYIRASGFNLLTSANDGGRAIVAVVLGGKSSKSRDAQMRTLVAENLPKASPGKRTAPLVAEGQMPTYPAPQLAPAPAAEPARVASAKVPVPMPRPQQQMARAEPTPSTAKDASIDLPTPVMAAVAASAPQPVEADVPQPAPRNPTMTPDAIANRIATANKLAMATTTPADELRWVSGKPAVQATAYAGGTTPGSGLPTPQQPQTARAAAPAPAPKAAPAPAPKIVDVPQTPSVAEPTIADIAQQPVPAPAHPAMMTMQPEPQMAAVEPAPVPEPTPAPRVDPVAEAPAMVRSGWLIQIAAVPDAAQAKILLERASGAVQSVNRDAESFTEPVEKDGVTLYRARFAGFSERTAVAACKAVKKTSLSCFTLKN